MGNRYRRMLHRMTHRTGHSDPPPAGSWGQELVSDAVPPEINALRAALHDIEDDHGDDRDCRDAVAEVRAALDRLSVALVRRAVLNESAHGGRRLGIRWTRALDEDR
jgi:hypothetical protein